MDNTLHTANDVVAILPTGTGKSLLFFLYAYANRHRLITSLVVVPTVSLRQDLLRRGEEHGILCSDILTADTCAKLVFLTPEAVVVGATRDTIARLHCSNRLGRIFIDEVHLFSTDDDYRVAYRQLPLLTFIPVPFVLMTATAPQWILTDVLTNFFPPSRQPVVVRQACNRPNIRYETKANISPQHLASIISSSLANCCPEERSIVYVPSLELLALVAEVFQSSRIPHSTYSGQQDPDANRCNFSSWREGKSKVMIAATAFGLGVDYAHVRLVACFGLPYSLEDFIQQSGRAGRDGKPSTALLTFDEAREQIKLQHIADGHRKQSLKQMLHFATTKDVCRRRMLTRHLDGSEIACNYATSFQLCDVCGDAVYLQESEESVSTDAEERLIDVSVGQAILSRERNLGQQLLHLVTKFNSLCIVCFVARKWKISHQSVGCCPTMTACSSFEN